MRLLVCIIFSVLLLGCDGEGTTAKNEAQNVPGGCTYVGDESHDFREWPTMTARKYECALFSRMTCHYYATDTFAYQELVCVNTSTPANGTPSGCALITSSGAHEFMSGGVLAVSGYQCGGVGVLSCEFFSSSSTTNEEFICLDNQD